MNNNNETKGKLGPKMKKAKANTGKKEKENKWHV